MSADPALRRATYADVEAVPPHLVAEIVDGTLGTHARPAPRHGVAALYLGYELTGPFNRGRDGPGGSIFIVEPELHLGADVLVPDLAGWRRERLQREPDTAFIEVAPDWVCEILSPSTERLDRGAKRRIYAREGVPHLWLLDPPARLLEASAPSAEGWLLLATIGAGETVQAAPFDAVGFPLDALFPFDDPAPGQASSDEA